MMAAKGTIVLLVVLIVSSAFVSGETWIQRVKRDKGGHHHQDVGRQRQVATTGDHRYIGSHVVRPPTGLNYPTTAVTIRHQIPSYQHFRHPARSPNQHKRMVPQRRPPVNANQLSHAPIGPVQQQLYAPQQPQRPAYLPVPLPIHLQPASIILPSPPPQSYQQPTPYVSPAAPASYGGYQQQPSQQQQYSQAPPAAPYQPPPPPPPPQQPQYQPPPPVSYQPPQPQFQPPPPPAPAPYQAPPQPQYQPPPPPPPPQQPAPPQYAPPPPPQQEYQPAPQQEYAPPPPPTPYQAAPASAAIEPLLPPPLYARQPNYQQQQAPTAEAYTAPQQDNYAPSAPAPEYATVSSNVQYAAQEATAAATYEVSQQQEQLVSVGGYSASEPVTVPPVVEEPGSYSTLAPLASEQDIHTNAISASSSSSSTDAKKEETSQWSQGSIPWTLEKLGLNTLNDLLVLSGLDEMFDKEGPFTVFVPVDQAFEILIQKFGGMEKASEEFNKNPDVLNSLLKHHVVPGAIQSSSLQNNAVMQSLLSSPLRVKFYESEDSEWRPLKVITVNGARVVKPDIQATNGVIHIVDRVLFPVPQADIYNTLKNDPQQRYTTLVSAIDRAGLTAVLANPTAGPYTVFAPTNKAFSLISRAELNGILNDPAKLTKLLQRHVVQDLIYTSGLQGFQKAYALDFEILYIYHAKGMTKVNGANVIDQDMTTLNGVVHTIDSVLGLY